MDKVMRMLVVMLGVALVTVSADTPPSWAIVECPDPFTWSNVSTRGNFMLSSGEGFVFLTLNRLSP